MLPNRSWLLALALTATALAQPPDIAPIPNTAPAWVRKQLQSQSDQLHRSEDQLELDVAAQRARCHDVEPNSPQWQQCHQERLLLEKRIETYSQQVQAFNDRIKGLEGTNGLESLAGQLASKPVYQAQGKQTQCSLFLRDFSNAWAGQPLPELEGRASQQIVQMQKLAAQPGSGWHTLSLKDGFQPAILAAYQGKLVVVAWLNPNPSDTNSGHVAVVMPKPPYPAGAKTSSGNPGWNMPAPYLAQAGPKGRTGPLVKLSEAFNPNMKPQLLIFVRDHP
jgi:hypothetical protein